MRLLTAFVFTTLLFVQATAQLDTAAIKVKPGRVFAGRLMYGAIVIHTKFIANTAGANPRDAELEFSKQYTDSATWRKCYCYPRAGVTVSITDLDTRILGKSYTATYFIEPNYRLGSDASIFLKAGGGLSYLTNPFDSIKNPENHTYSLPVNFFLTLGAGVSYHVSPKVGLEAMIGFQHNSNGDFQKA